MRFAFSAVLLLTGIACLLFAATTAFTSWSAAPPQAAPSAQVQPFTGRILRGGNALQGGVEPQPYTVAETTLGAAWLDTPISKPAISGVVGLLLAALLVGGLKAWRRRKAERGKAIPTPPARPFRFRPKHRMPAFPQVVIDGSNVLHWRDNIPDIGTLQALITTVHKQGYEPIIWFDANVGYKIADRYLGPEALAQKLRLRPEQIHVAESGSPADPWILAMAGQLDAPIISRDKFRDFDGQYPWLRQKGRLKAGKVEAADFGIHLPPRRV